MALSYTASNSNDQLLPTFFKWRKENQFENEREYGIVKVLWNSSFKSITFFTEHFRYSVKLDSEEAFNKECKSLKTALCKYCYAVVKVGSDKHSVFIDKVTENSPDFQQFDWFDWGLVIKKSSR